MQREFKLKRDFFVNDEFTVHKFLLQHFVNDKFKHFVPELFEKV
jgi:hypothetical protein